MNGEKIENELEHYKKIYGTGDVATRGYKAIVRILEQQIEFLDQFELNDHVTQDPKLNPKYERALKMYREMPEVIMSLKELKDKLGIEYVEKTERVQATTPQSVGLLNKGI